MKLTANNLALTKPMSLIYCHLLATSVSQVNFSVDGMSRHVLVFQLIRLNICRINNLFT